MISVLILSACSNKALVENPTSDKIEEDSAKDSTNTSRNKQENSERTKEKNLIWDKNRILLFYYYNIIYNWLL